jgi:hypothetical protein
MVFTPITTDSGFIEESYDAMAALRSDPNDDVGLKNTLQFSTRILLRRVFPKSIESEVDRIVERLMTFLKSDTHKTVLMKSICRYNPQMGFLGSPNDDFLHVLYQKLPRDSMFPENGALQNIIRQAFHHARPEEAYAVESHLSEKLLEHAESLIASRFTLQDEEETFQEALFKQAHSAIAAVNRGQSTPGHEKRLLASAIWCIFRHQLPEQEPETLEKLAYALVRARAYKKDNGMLINTLGDMHQGLAGAVNLDQLAVRVRIMGSDAVLTELKNASPPGQRTLQSYSCRQLAGWTEKLLDYMGSDTKNFPFPGLLEPALRPDNPPALSQTLERVEKYNGWGQSAENILWTFLSPLTGEVTETRSFKQNREDVALLLEKSLERALSIAFIGLDRRAPRPGDVIDAAREVFGDEGDGFLLQSLREQAGRIRLNSDVAGAKNHLALMEIQREAEMSELEKDKNRLDEILQNTTNTDPLFFAREAVSLSESQVRTYHERVNDADNALKAAKKALKEYDGGTVGLNFDILAADGANGLKKRLRQVQKRAEGGVFRFSPDASFTVQLMDAMACYLEQVSVRLAAHRLGVAKVFAKTVTAIESTRQDERIHAVLREAKALSPEVREAWIATFPRPIQPGDVVPKSGQEEVLQEIAAYRTLAYYLAVSTPENFEDAAEAIKALEQIRNEHGNSVRSQTLAWPNSGWGAKIASRLADLLPADPLKIPEANAEMQVTIPLLGGEGTTPHRMRAILLKTAIYGGLGVGAGGGGMMMLQDVRNSLYNWVWPPAATETKELGESNDNSPAKELLMLSPHQVRFDASGILIVETTAQTIRELIAKYNGELNNTGLHKEIAQVLKHDGIMRTLSEKLETTSYPLHDTPPLNMMASGNLLSRIKREADVDGDRLSLDDQHVVTEVIKIISTEHEDSDVTLFNSGLINYIEMKSGRDIPDDREEAWLTLYQNYLSAQDEWYRHLGASNATLELKHESRKRLITAHFDLSALEAELKGDITGGRDAYIKGLDVINLAKSNDPSVRMGTLQYKMDRNTNGNSWSSNIDIPNFLVFEKAATRDAVGGVVLYDIDGAWSYFTNRTAMYQYLDIRRLEQDQLGINPEKESILRRSVIRATAPGNERMQMLRYFNLLDQRADMATAGKLSMITLKGKNYEEKFDLFVDTAMTPDTVNSKASKLDNEAGQARKELAEFLSNDLVNYDEYLHEKTSRDFLKIFQDKGIALNTTTLDASNIELKINNLAGTAVEWVDKQFRNRHKSSVPFDSDNLFISNNHIAGKVIHYIGNLGKYISDTFNNENNELATGEVMFTKSQENLIPGKNATETLAILNENTELKMSIIAYFRRTYVVDQYRKHLTNKFMPAGSDFNKIWTKSEVLNLKLAVENAKSTSYISDIDEKRILSLIEGGKDPFFRHDKIGGVTLSYLQSKVEIPEFYTFTLKGNPPDTEKYIYIPDELYGQNLYTLKDFKDILQNDYGNLWDSVQERTQIKDKKLISNVRDGVNSQRFSITSVSFNNLSDRANTTLLGYINDIEQTRTTRNELINSMIIKGVNYVSNAACVATGGIFIAACGTTSAARYAIGVKDIIDEMERGNLDEALVKAWMLPLDVTSDMLPAFTQLLKLTGRSTKVLSLLVGKPIKTARDVNNAVDTVLSWKKFFLTSGELNPDVAIKNLNFNQLRIDNDRVLTKGEFWVSSVNTWERGDKTWIKSKGLGYEVYSDNGWADIRVRDPFNPNSQGPIIEWKNGEWYLTSNTKLAGGGKIAKVIANHQARVFKVDDDIIRRELPPIAIARSDELYGQGNYEIVGYHVSPINNRQSLIENGFSIHINEGAIGGVGGRNKDGPGLYVSKVPSTDYIPPDQGSIIYAVVRKKNNGNSWVKSNERSDDWSTVNIENGDFVQSRISSDLKITPQGIPKVEMLEIGTFEKRMNGPSIATFNKPPKNLQDKKALEFINNNIEQFESDVNLIKNTINDSDRLDLINSLANSFFTLPEKPGDIVRGQILRLLKSDERLKPTS